jgi:hypothetical protein
MMMLQTKPAVPVAILAKSAGTKGSDTTVPEPIFGGYANARGDISLFGEGLNYRVDFKNRTIQQRPPLNFGAQFRYDRSLPGESFKFGRITFRRLEHVEIQEICASGPFRVRPKFA